MPNRLAGESSPYLLQHAHNPVDWYPWGPEALERARREDRPVFLSIGYSACHWCHVMERESFADPDVAALMNEAFVCVKVDREERPDLDGIYMKAVQALTGRGGWPLSAFLTPAGEPFYGGTYFPPEPRHGMPAFRQVLAGVAEAWRDRRDQVLDSALALREALERAVLDAVPGDGGQAGATGSDDGALVAGAVRHLRERFDAVRGGFGGAPKFPQPTTLELLLAYGASSGDGEAVSMVTRTLDAMALGGIRDHLGGGFHRYSVDARWLVPHFEKMLYDNALLARLYTDAWRVTGELRFREVAEDTLAYLLADLRTPEGGFYAARDADSEGEEGRFYLWTPEQVSEAVDDAERAALLCRVYGVEPGGNFEGRSILHLRRPLEAEAEARGMTRDDLRDALAPARRTLLEARARREPPFRDTKVLCSWSAFAVRALAEAGGAMGRDDWLEAARQGARFLSVVMRADGELRHVWTDGVPGPPAFLEDRAALGNALLSLHEATLEPSWLEAAAGLCAEMLDRHWDADAGVFYDDARGGEPLVVRPREVMDQATPSGTSLAVELLLRAAHLLDREGWAEVARRALDHERPGMARFPAAFGRLLTQRVRLETPPVEVVVAGARGDDDTRALLRRTLASYHAHRVVSGVDPSEPAPEAWPLLQGRGPVDGRPAA